VLGCRRKRKDRVVERRVQIKMEENQGYLGHRIKPMSKVVVKEHKLQTGIDGVQKITGDRCIHV
jgi:hypothetical protein